MEKTETSNASYSSSGSRTKWCDLYAVLKISTYAPNEALFWCFSFLLFEIKVLEGIQVCILFFSYDTSFFLTSTALASLSPPFFLCAFCYGICGRQTYYTHSFSLLKFSFIAYFPDLEFALSYYHYYHYCYYYYFGVTGCRFYHSFLQSLCMAF